MAKERRELTEIQFSHERSQPLSRRNRTTRAALTVAAALTVVVPIPTAAEWQFTTIPRSTEEKLPSRLSYEVTFEKSTFGNNKKAHNQIRNFFNSTKQHGSLVVETSIRGGDERARISCGQKFDARKNTTVVEQYKQERKSLISRLIGEHREYVDMSRVFGERLVRGEVTGSDDRALKLAVSLRTYSEDVRLAMADFTNGLDEFSSNVANTIKGAEPGLDIASLAFSAFTRRYDTTICAETSLPLQDLSDVRWIVFYDNSKGVIDTQGIDNPEILTNRLIKIGAYALFIVDVKNYHCRTSRTASLRQCQLTTKLMRDWLGASQLGKKYDGVPDQDFNWEIKFSPVSASTPVKGSASTPVKGVGMSTLVAGIKLDNYIGNYRRIPDTGFPMWTVLGALWRDTTNGGECLEDFIGELTFSDNAGEEMTIAKLVINNVKYDGSDNFTLSRQGESKRVYPSQKRTHFTVTRCQCLRKPKSMDCTAQLNSGSSPSVASTSKTIPI